MKTITNYIKRQNNLLALSAWITIGIMVLLFILAQILSFTGLMNDSDYKRNKMEVYELIKFRFTPQLQPESRKKVSEQTKKAVNTKHNVNNKREQQKTDKTLTVASFYQGFDMKKLISQEVNTVKRGNSNPSHRVNVGISTKVDRRGGTVENYDLKGSLKNRKSSMAAARKSARGGAQGPKVEIGETNHVDTGSGSSPNGVDFSRQGTNRTTRRTGKVAAGTVITLPSVSGGHDVVVDIHALIKWMKAHPGTIPKLVAYEMGHQAGDVSSSVSFNMNGRTLRLFLSCNEFELLLRICLVKGNDFTLLKDNGIREESNFLTIGDVVRDSKGIQSLISSRKAPGDKAAIFYQIFWSWWQQQPESRG